MNTIVELINVNKFYDKNHVVRDLSMTVNEGEFLSILGSSGCGKTTTLRMIAGFEQQTDGIITIEGKSMEDKEPFERNVNTVFQSYALFPHMTVFDNVAYGPRMNKVPKAEIKKLVEETLELVRLSQFGSRYPSQLSGGQRQRVAIARAIINKPKVLLLDEPLGALDMKLRKQMQLELKNLQKTLGITFIYVTHDQEEALIMSDRIAVMNHGVLEQIGTPHEIYDYPKTKFVADFIGETNLFEVITGEPSNGLMLCTLDLGHITAAVSESHNTGELVCISIRPEDTLFSDTPVEGFSLKGTVRESIYVGSIVQSIIELDGGQVVRVSTNPSAASPQVGSSTYIHWNPHDASIIKMKAGEVIEAFSHFSLGNYVTGVWKGTKK